MGTIYKTVRKQFDYMHCDDLAAYLSEMAAKGWHFKMWNRGWMFEKGEPEEATYAVEVITKGKEDDSRPNRDIFEFGECCEQVGWKFVDAHRKFCILKKVEPDARPVFTKQERVNNVVKLEYPWIDLLFGGVLGSLIFLLGALWDLPNSLFSEIGVLRFFTGVIGALTCLWYLGCGLFHRIRYARALQKGKDVYIGTGKRRQGSWLLFDACIWLVCAVTSVECIISGKNGKGIYYIVVIGIMVLCRFLLLKKTSSSIEQLGRRFLMVWILIFSIPNGMTPATVISEEAIRELPFQVMHYREHVLEMEQCRNEHESSVLGKHDTYQMIFQPEEHGGYSIWYEVYETGYNWVLNVTWNSLLAEQDEITDCTDAWGAITACQNESGDYFVRYEDVIFVLWELDGVSLDADQIAIIRYKMDLK